MTNVQQNPNQKTQDDRYSNQSNPNQSGSNQPGQNKTNEAQKGTSNKDTSKDNSDANRKGGMQNDPSGQDKNARNPSDMPISDGM